MEGDGDEKLQTLKRRAKLQFRVLCNSNASSASSSGSRGLFVLFSGELH